VYDLKTKELLFTESNANSVAWNTQNNDMLCFSGNGFLHIKADNFPLHQQKMPGFVVGFSGSNIYCLHVFSMTAVEVPQSHSMFQYLKNKEFRKAYRVACLGVTEADWEALAAEALEGLDLEVAKYSYARVRNLRYLDLIHSLEERRKSSGGELDRELTLADIYAYQGQFDDAAKLYVRNGGARKALEMFCDLRMFDKAKDYLDSSNADDAKFLMKKQAEWCKTANDPTLAVDILSAAGEEIASVNVMGENGMVQKLIEKARKLNKAEVEVLSKIAEWLQKLDQVPLAAEVCQKIGDNKMLTEIYVKSGKWDDAFALAERHPELSHEVYVPYANWLAENDRFEEAQAAFNKAGMQDRATEVLEVLTHNAVMERRFNDAGYYFFELSKSALAALESAAAGDDTAEPDAELLARYKEYQRRADLYFAYHAIQRYIDEPFTSHLPESLFNIARYILQEVGSDVPHGISRVSCLFALAKQSRNLGAFKVARTAYEKLQAFKLPASVRNHIDLGAITIRSKPFSDKEELQPVCYRCSTPNPLVTQGPSKCINCGQPFVYSQHSFEVLPLVEFFLDIDIADDEALRLIA
jgi:intraflagellar transport protein 122